MRPTLAPLCALTLLLACCGTIAEGDGGNSNLPERGIIGWTKLEPPLDDEGEPLEGAEQPFVLFDEDAAFDEPAAIVVGDEVWVYFTAESDGRTVIQRATSGDGTAFGEPRVAIEADGDLRSPSVLRVGSEYRMWYLADGSLGLATSSDGRAWSVESDAVFTPPEGELMDGPAVIAVSNGFALYYGAGELDEDDESVSLGIVLARSPDGVEWTRDDFVLAPESGCREGEALVRCWDELLVTSPAAVVSISPVGRELVDLWYTGAVGSDTGIGFAGSFDGRTFSRYTLNPVVNHGSPEAHPSVGSLGGTNLMFFSYERDGRRAIAVARR